MNINILKKKKYLVILLLLNINLSIFTKPVKALTPHIYLPKEKTLINTSIKLGIIASQYIKYGQNKIAISFAKLAIKLNPKELQLWTILSQAQLNNNLLDEAIKSIEEAQKLNPQLEILWRSHASILLQQGKLEKAILSIKKSIKLNDNNSNSYFLLGNARLMQKNYSKALLSFKQASKINPKFWQAINNEGLVYYELGNKGKAIKIWRKVLKLESNAEPKLALAIALYSLNTDNTESIALAKQALEEDPNYFYIQHQKEQLWGERLQNDGKKLFRDPKLMSTINTTSENTSFTNNQ
ncbi:tetratricopeptide repeat protein [Prochlorococcus marinus]|uniref:tetratricopeptide repeat protein n=1 Tax=Prochlorococcus marinus TaxID=1219 RepID=UPI0022B53AD4|nr:tetratricopeptide repeat protein [Prochlorococcus marinus]